MNDFYEKKEAGKTFAVIRGPMYTGRLEERMLRNVSGPYYLTPRYGYEDGADMLCYDVSRYADLGSFLAKNKVGFEPIRMLFCGICEAVSGMDRFMLSEDNICLIPERIYVSEDGRDLRFLPVPSRCEEAEAKPGRLRRSIKRLCEHLLLSCDTGDTEAIRLLCSIYQETGKDDDISMSRLAELLDMPPDQEDEQSHVGDMEQGQLREELYQSYRDGLAVPEKAERVERIFTQEYAGHQEPGPTSAIEAERDIREETGSDTGKRELLLKLLIVMGIMSAAALAVIGLRGTEAFFRLLPVFAVLCLTMTAFFVIGHIEGRIRKRAEGRAQGTD